MPKLIAEMLLIIGIIVGGVLLWRLLKGLKAKHWPTAPGLVIDSQVTTEYGYDDEGDQTVNYDAAISYRYEVGGYAHTGNRRSFTAVRPSSMKAAQKIVDQYAVGTSVKVFYQLDEPDESVLEPGGGTFIIVLMIVPLILIAVGTAGLLGLM